VGACQLEIRLKLQSVPTPSGVGSLHLCSFSVILKGGAIVRNLIFGAGILVLGLATLMWATTPTKAQHGGHGGGGHASGGHVGAGPAAAHVGSVHYATHAAPAPVRPAVRAGAGAVRSEHYAGSPSRGGHSNPYSDEYFRHFRPGYVPYLLGDAQYYGYDTLPLGYQEVVIDGITYYLLDGVYYQAYLYGGQTVYLVVPPPG